MGCDMIDLRMDVSSEPTGASSYYWFAGLDLLAKFGKDLGAVCWWRHIVKLSVVRRDIFQCGPCTERKQNLLVSRVKMCCKNKEVDTDCLNLGRYLSECRAVMQSRRYLDPNASPPHGEPVLNEIIQRPQ